MLKIAYTTGIHIHRFQERILSFGMKAKRLNVKGAEMKRLRAEEVRANKVRELNRLANGLFKSAWR